MFGQLNFLSNNERGDKNMNTSTSCFTGTNTSSLFSIKQGENEMADVDTLMLSQEHSDIRREQAEQSSNMRREGAEHTSDVRREAAEHTNEIVKEGLKGDYLTQGAIKDARFDINGRIAGSTSDILRDVDRVGDSLTDRFFTVGRDTADLRAQVIQAIDTVKMSTELNALKGIIEGQKNTTYLSDKITDDGEKTRSLINDLKYHDLNRALVERQTALVNAEQDNRHWHHRYYDARWDQNASQFGAQFAQLQSMMQNFNSQLNETRQGMVNFGTMAGVGQSSTNNNVR